MCPILLFGGLVIFGLGSHMVLGENLMSKMIKDDPTTWVCNGQPLRMGEAMKKPVAFCHNRAGMCKNMCFLQHLGMITDDRKLDEIKTKILLDAVIPNATDATSILKEIMACSGKIVSNDTAPDCTGNTNFFRCVKLSVTNVCRIPVDSFGYIRENVQGRSVGQDEGKPGYAYMNKSLARSIANDFYQGTAESSISL